MHSVALKADGSIVAWGYNGNGECNVPQGNDYIAIAAGNEHNVALRADGSLVAWGENGDGECNVPPGNDFFAISASFKYSLALKSDGSLVAWGRIDDLFQTYLVPSGNDFVAIAAGGFVGIHSVAIKSDGTVVAWGDNDKGQCDVPDGNDFVAIVAGSAHNLAVRSDGSVVAWGYNNQGQCDVPAVSDAIAVAAGSSHSVALLKEPTEGFPVADAGSNIVARANEEVTLDASSSYDQNGEIILYTWKRLPDEVVIYSGQEPTCKTRALGRAEEVIELTVTDNDYITTSDTVTIINRLIKKLKDQLDSMAISDLNLDRSTNMDDFALLAENWLE